MFGFGTKKYPDTHDIASRAYALRSVITWCIATPPPDVVERLQQDRTPDEWSRFAREINTMNANRLQEIEKQPYAKALTPTERTTLKKPFGEATWQDFLDVQWRLESLQVLLWALGRISTIAPIGSAQQASDEILKPPVMPPFDAEVSTWQLRSRSEIEKARDLAELWHWRSRTRELIESGATLNDDLTETTGFRTYDEIVRSVAQAAAADGTIEITDDDFSVKGAPYRDISADEWSVLRSITMERHFALNWLCGYAPKHRWDETPTDT